jgi:hypothetical protein
MQLTQEASEKKVRERARLEEEAGVRAAKVAEQQQKTAQRKRKGMQENLHLGEDGANEDPRKRKSPKALWADLQVV